MANLSSLNVVSLAAALSSVALGDVLTALAINARSGDSVDAESFADSINDLISGAVDKANHSLAETKAIDVLVRREVSRMVLDALTTNAAKDPSKADKASGASRADIEASLLKILVTQSSDVANLNFKELTDTIDSALDRCIASKQDDGTLTNPNAPFVSGKGKGGIKPNGVSASVLATRFAAEYDAYVRSLASEDDAGEADSDSEADTSELR